jgi:hypothetical protein
VSSGKEETWEVTWEQLLGAASKFFIWLKSESVKIQAGPVSSLPAFSQANGPRWRNVRNVAAAGCVFAYPVSGIARAGQG